MSLRKGKSEQELFFEELRGIQDFVVGLSLCKQDKYKNTEEMLEDITYEAIYRVFEMIDGYGNNSTKYKLVNTQNGNTLNEDFELHDRCADYLRYTDI